MLALIDEDRLDIVTCGHALDDIAIGHVQRDGLTSGSYAAHVHDDRLAHLIASGGLQRHVLDFHMFRLLRRLAVVSFHVLLPAAQARVRAAARVARTEHVTARLARVRAQVRAEVARLREALAALGTLIRLLARVQADVALQVGAARERVVAVRANVRLVARVRQHVLLHLGLLAKRLEADRAVERPFAGVNAVVNVHILARVEAFLADVAEEAKFALVDAQMRGHVVARDGLATFGARDELAVRRARRFIHADHLHLVGRLQLRLAALFHGVADDLERADGGVDHDPGGADTATTRRATRVGVFF